MKNVVISLLLGLMGLTGCGSLSVYSTPPESEVRLLVPGQGEPKLVGKTPYLTSIGELEGAVNSGPIAITVSKQGYVPQYFIIPNLSNGKLEIKATLVPNLPNNFKEVNRVVDLSFKAERFLMQKQYDEAIKAAEEIQKINENVSSSYQIQGTAYFLKNNLEKSRFAWIRALELDPNQPEAHRMLEIVESKLGVPKTSTNSTGSP